MADNDKKSGAQHELGNLFVDIGSSGLGGLLKGLNSLSATFLLSKNAAEQFAKPIIGMSQTAGKGVVALDKIRAVTGLTLDELQRLEAWSGLNNIDFNSFIGQIQNAQKTIMEVRTGMRQMPEGFARLGITAYDFNANNPIDFLNQVMAKLSQVDEVTRANMLDWMGLSRDLAYAWERGNQTLDERLFLNKEQLENLKQQQDAWNTLGVTIKLAFRKWISDQSIANDGLKNLANNTDQVTELVNVLGTAFNNLVTSAKWAYKWLKKIWNFINNVAVTNAAVDATVYNGNFLTSKDYATLLKDPVKRKKYQDAMKKFNNAQDKLIQEAWQEAKNQKIEKKANRTTPHQAPVMQYTPTQQGGYYQPTSGSKNGFGVTGSQLISPTPINDFSAPASVNSQLPPVPAHLQTNNVSNNISFQINQTITGDNAEQIATASANAIDNASMNILQAQNQWAV
jgi:hypothetical protein